ncbi:Importin-beta N-terminal domain-containing protein [Dioscorea alata]|uniref:Importin-beta N-terminal domain-containing protein n=1 Tax=Dioscorea alata TaxID=55571 RepID=A0ACB7VTM6_DIOAL|nr:Importin-beta N-terminal domain-containing protein [Dioscorea alata]
MALSASDVQTLYSMLLSSLSPEVSERSPAESALSQCESRPGFCSCLLEIIASRDLACREDVRLLASVYFKNSINRYWRNRRDSAGITNDEKTHLRKKLLLHLREENSQIAMQLAVLVSKIARIDYPKEWPELFTSLAHQLQSSDILASQRIFMVLFRTLKELSTKRLTADQRTFSEIASNLFEYTWNLWQSDAQTILQSFSNLSQGISVNSSAEHQNILLLTCERWLLCSKIIRQLIVCGHPSDVTSAQVVRQVKKVCPVLLNAIQSFLPYYVTFLEGQQKLWDFTRRSCVKLMKILISIQLRHPYSFGDKLVLPAVLDFCLNKITNLEPTTLSFEQFLIQCMVLVKSILQCKEYRPQLTGCVINESGESLEQRKRNSTMAVIDILTTVLPSERVMFLCNILVRRFFVYTAKDLDEWYQNPESFHHEQDMIQWTEKLRPCAEALYIVLFENNRDLLAPVVVSMLHEAMSGSPPSHVDITPEMLLKDAAYTAAGHVYYELSNFLNFTEWFKTTLAVELANDHPNMRIIHRKIAVILGQWVSEIKGDTGKLVYHSLIRLLQDNDIAVRLAACRSLCYLVQDSNFSEQDFFELLPTCWGLCFKLVENAQEFDSKVQVLNLISVLIEHVGDKIIPFASQLSEFFHKMWEESIGESLLQIQLLAALRNFVCSLGYQSPVCYNVLLPILQRGIDVNNPDALNLLEDSVLLWESTLSHASSVVPQLLDFFPYLAAILERSFDHLEVAVSIIEGYIIFGGPEFLNRHASSLVKLLDGIVGNVNDKGLLSLFSVIDILIQCFPVEVPPLISGVLQKLFVICLTGEDNHNPSKTTVRTACGAILARLLVMNTNYLAHLASETSLALVLQQAGLSTNQNILLCLVDMWLDKMDNGTKIQRKTYALALAVILTLRLPEVMDKLDDILSVCTSVILGGGEEVVDEDSSSSDTTSSSAPCSETFGYGAVQSKEFRRKQIKDSDPIKRLSLEDVLRENLKTCAAIHGEGSFNAAVSRIHPSAFAQLQQALKMA